MRRNAGSTSECAESGQVSRSTLLDVCTPLVYSLYMALGQARRDRQQEPRDEQNLDENQIIGSGNG